MKDVYGNANAAASMTFHVTIPDTTPPTAAFTAPDVDKTASETSESVTVVYTDDVAVNPASIGVGAT